MTLVQVKARCHQPTSHYMNQFWPRSMLPYGITRTNWLYTLTPWPSNIQYINEVYCFTGYGLNGFLHVQYPAYHYSDVIMDMMVSQITSISIVCSTIGSGADQRKYQSSVSLAFMRGIHRWPLNSAHKGLVMQKMFPFDDFITYLSLNWFIIASGNGLPFVQYHGITWTNTVLVSGTKSSKTWIKL